mmetsp:Transcript_10611/g.12070  ORF Transcript_10611/g.12070 Transcript_10611/m.12070 type:complete len:318 (+) Transcript_10611:16-969(+)
MLSRLALHSPRGVPRQAVRAYSLLRSGHNLGKTTTRPNFFTAFLRRASSGKKVAEKASKGVAPKAKPEAKKVAAKAKPDAERWGAAARWMHWIGAAGMVGCVSLVLVAQQIPKDKEKSSADALWLRKQVMHYHESIGIVMLAAMVPRLGIRLLSRVPKALPGPRLEHFVGDLSHYLLYGAIIFMPVSGFAFGYYSGWGVPFFVWDIPGAAKEDQNEELNQWFYEWHHNIGWALTYGIGLHVGAVGYHQLLRRHRILDRMAKAPSAKKFAIGLGALGFAGAALRGFQDGVPDKLYASAVKLDLVGESKKKGKGGGEDH